MSDGSIANKWQKPTYQICWDGLLFIYLYFIEKDPKIVGAHLYNIIMKQIMKSKYQEIGLWILAYKLLSHSSDIVDTFKERNAGRIIISLMK